MTDKALTIFDQGAALDVADTHSSALTVGQAANQAAAAWSFIDYRARKSANTLRTHDAALALFAQFLVERGAAGAQLDAAALASDPAAWHGVTWLSLIHISEPTRPY